MKVGARCDELRKQVSELETRAESLRQEIEQLQTEAQDARKADADKHEETKTVHQARIEILKVISEEALDCLPLGCRHIGGYFYISILEKFINTHFSSFDLLSVLFILQKKLEGIIKQATQPKK